MNLALLWLLLAVVPSSPDTLVICPAEFRPALARWSDYRRGQGHAIVFAEAPRDAAGVTAAIRRTAQGGRLKYVLLVGDVPATPHDAASERSPGIPTNYTPAHINTRWGSEPTIASDIPYADLDGDEVPDLAIGRIPADSVEELAAVLSKTLRYEQAESGDWQRRLNVVVGAGGFGAVTDALVEAAGRHVIRQTVPGEYQVRHTPAPRLGADPALNSIHRRVCEQLGEGSLAWIYLGHGLPTELDRVSTERGMEPILSVNDVAQLRCGAATPLAVLIACYTGAIDAPRDCLAEEMSLSAEGPVAAIAATRVTMPYGNTVFGYELLRACFRDECPTVGEIVLMAQQRTKREATDDAMRQSLDAMCRGLSPPPVDLTAERSEHVLMYHLLGDPLLRMRRWQIKIAQDPNGDPGTK